MEEMTLSRSGLKESLPPPAAEGAGRLVDADAVPGARFRRVKGEGTTLRLREVEEDGEDEQEGAAAAEELKPGVKLTPRRSEVGRSGMLTRLEREWGEGAWMEMSPSIRLVIRFWKCHGGKSMNENLGIGFIYFLPFLFLGSA